MDRRRTLFVLQAHEAELKALGVAGLQVFGSAARGDERPDSDVDVAVRLSDAAQVGGFAYFGRLDALHTRLSSILGRPVDLVVEPVRKERLRRAIAAEGVRAF